MVRRLHDTANAFPSFSFQAVDDYLFSSAWQQLYQRHPEPAERQIMDMECEIDIIRKQMWYATTSVNTADTEVHLKPSSGVFAGSSTACKLFNGAYAKPIATWIDQQSAVQPLMLPRCPCDNQVVQVHTTGYVDDIANMSVHPETQAVVEQDASAASSLEQHLHTAGVALHKSNAVKQLLGRRSKTAATNPTMFPRRDLTTIQQCLQKPHDT